MPWPALTDFSDAVQNPRLCFQGTELEAGTVAVNQRGLPLVFSGNFACVYSVSVGNRKYAVRCFTREITDQQSRYGQLSHYLIDVLPPAFVYFEYLDRGISFKGDWYPIVKMEWVDGEPLSKFVGSRLNEPDTLRRIAGRWRGGTTASLRGLRIAHNDLQHGNVMVQTDGNIRLVDYDGIFLPQFRGERSPELGHKNYQHPQRSSEDYDDYVDNFPSLVIYLSLLAIASDPGLWSFYNDDNLIFTRNDFADPGGSEIFNRLKNSPDLTVAKLTERLENYCALPVEKVPDLEAALQDIPSVRAPSQTAVPRAAPTPPPPTTTASGYRQILRGPQSAPAHPATAPAQPRPAAPPAASPASAAQPAMPTPPPATRSWSTSRTVVIAPAPPISSQELRSQLKKVILGVAVTVIAVVAVMVGLMAWSIAQNGWDPLESAAGPSPIPTATSTANAPISTSTGPPGSTTTPIE